jgi:hypothetical protein
MMNWEGHRKKQTSLRYYSSICLEGLREMKKKFSQDCQSSD